MDNLENIIVHTSLEGDMNITFLLGNGFDLGLGMNTRYEDFFEVYCEENPNDNENIKDFKQILREYNEGENRIINWSDFELAFGQHAKDFNETNKEDYLERFKDFLFGFNDYLENEVQNCDFSNEKKIGDMMYNATGKYYHIREEDKQTVQQLHNENPNWVYNFISFNYTRSIDLLSGMLEERIKPYSGRKLGTVMHIHGYIEENMIMGVNDTSQILNSNFADDEKVLKYIVKPYQNKEIKSMYDSKATELIGKSNVICIYGMSLGETDKKWWSLLLEWLTNNSKNLLVVLVHNNNYNKRFPQTQSDVIDEIRNRLLSYSNLTGDVNEAIAQRILIGVNNDVFSLNLRINLSET